MSRLLKLCGQGARWCGACVLSFGLWTFWLVLVLLLGVQVYIASTNQLEVPAFVLRAFEERLAASGMRTTFGRTSFDPSGRVLVENAQITLPSYAEPVVTARAIYVRLDPWALAVGKFEPRELRVTGTSWSVPAMLSPSGRPEEILRDLDATLVPHEHEIAIEQLVARIAGVVVSARGSVHLPGVGVAKEKPLPLADFLAHNYPALCRQISSVAERLAALESPTLHLELTPSDTRGAIASATLLAHSFKLTAPVPVHATGLRIVTRVPLLGDAPVAARLELTADELELPFDAIARRVRAVVHGTLQPTKLLYEPREFQLTAGSVSAAGYTTGAVAARLTPAPLPKIDADIFGTLFGAPLAVQARTDFQKQTAQLRFEGGISPEIFGPLTKRLGVDVRRWFNFESLTCREGAVSFGPGWKFEKVTTHVTLHNIDAHHVLMEEGHAQIEFDGHRLYSPDAYARVGDNYARGTYEHDMKTRDYRFLLEGRLRPLAISGWWPSGWWENFFKQFDFAAAAPVASVDVQGRWGDARESAVFVAADVAGPIIRGGKFDRVRTLLFVRPSYYDGIECFVTSGTGAARGTFTYTTDHETFAWRQLDLKLKSTLELGLAAQIAGPAGAELLKPFQFARPPQLTLDAQLTAPTAPGGAHQSVDIVARTDGEFRLHDFPLEPVAFTAKMRDDVLTIDGVEAGFAGGALAGHAKVWGRDHERRVSFDYSLKGASLGLASAALQEYSARQKKAPPPAPGKFVQEKANVRIDLNAAAEGLYNDPLSYQGTGAAALQGAELGEVRMLGLLSELLKFTALRFTTANAKFKIDGKRLAFSEVKLAGANSAIEATGDYALDRRELDFKAKVYPLHESGNFFKKLIELGLSPLTAVLEVKLTGTLDKPEWSLGITPTNLLKALSPTEPGADKNASPPATEKPPAPPATPPPKP